ncbi:MAG: hypothetical protein ACYTF7_08085 [Planctomycetota bacterium]|jgi:hypothetical protein
MEFLTQLWMAIVVAAVIVFVASSVFHMVLPLHKKDVSKMPNEDTVTEALRSAGVGPGCYMFPGCDDMKEWSTDEHKAKVEKGPVGWMTIMPRGGFNMGKSLGQWFLYTLIVSAFVGYVSWNSLSPTSDYMHVFRISGAVAFMAYGVGAAPESIWKGAPWKVTAKFIFVDGLVYALVTAGAFGWLWPAIEAAVDTPALPG